MGKLGITKGKLIRLKSGSSFETGSELLVKQESGSEGDARSVFFLWRIKEILRRSIVITNRSKSRSGSEAESELLVKQESGSEGDASSAFFGLIKKMMLR
jgi:hypothetical protein